ncbi:MAG: hypothetical protein KDD64_04615 [Bdellovibrionales bacterium]|nr:hypothetical protein [Bdellovibrionales bacterium]
MEKFRQEGSERGAVALLVAVFIAVLLAVVSFVVDLGKTWQEQRAIQAASDNAVFSAARVLRDTQVAANEDPLFVIDEAILETSVRNEADIIANSNDLLDSEFLAEKVKFISWNGSPVDPHNLPEVSPLVANAVYMRADRVQQSYFGRLFGVKNLYPHVYAIAGFTRETITETTPICMRPFGVENQNITDLAGGPEGEIQWGSTILTVGNHSPANWGKIDLDGNMSSGHAFEEAMQNGACDLDPVPFIGQAFSPGTGFGGSISQVFNDLYNSGIDEQRHWLIAGVDEFPNGNSGLVTVMNFYEVYLNALTIGNGNNWSAELLLLAQHDSPLNAVSETSRVVFGDRKLVQ